MTAKRAKPRKRAAKKKKAPAARSPETIDTLLDRITRKGKALVAVGKPSRQEPAPALEHDRPKSYLLPADSRSWASLSRPAAWWGLLPAGSLTRAARTGPDRDSG